ncbi:TetR/AcrR family transcriptional regulator [Thermobispora bispora]|uniref:Transcriptional regulator, TetR family n=2 Tax=Thermobispora bispora TaxID=2006 RepID=D6YA73_THEBD|nr:TetR/AcrR family transcriptional regulator [Thermobispora bispora]ADG88216.1 transcriptional regulator, TetR family [Thermobispora bispora DSM 43833]MBX6168050.1 TetR/AcrR family transcriptional regulator C-terminal domain-containing protein [Thermobispora bispora]MDI9580637.1 TetR/AcrR family transcriptional regulator [Thermobispora sp.]QSI48043.1 TetR family transcriptional regulator [Thermobispora bispora]
MADRAGEEGIPAPPWRKRRKPAQPKRQLSLDLIIEAGLRILDTEGLGALSMRRVAQELDTGPASLYAHVANKDELLELLYDRVLGEIRLPERDPARWKEQLRAYALEMHRVLKAHRDVARAALATIPTGENSVRTGEFVFGLLVEAGMPPREAAVALDRLSLYVVGDAYEASLHHARMRAAGFTDKREYFESWIGQIKSYYRALPPERFPHLTKHVDDLVDAGGEERFRYGLELILDGIEARMTGTKAQEASGPRAQAPPGLPGGARRSPA